MGPPGGQDDEAVRQGTKAVVLVRFNATICEKKQEERFRGFFPFKIASMEKMEEPREAMSLPAAFPGPEAGSRGWRYFLLEPGTYHLDGDAAWYGMFYRVKDPQSVIHPPLALRVPLGRPFVYGGSLSQVCRCEPGLFSDTVTDCASGPVVDETDQARAAAGALVERYGEPFVSLLVPFHTLSAPFGGEEARGLAPLGILVRGGESLHSPDWMNRGLERGLAPGAIFLSDPRGILIFLAYAPVGLLAGSLGGAHSRHRWQPCMERLAGELKDVDPAQEISRRLLDLLKKGGFENTAVLKGDEGYRDLAVKTILPVEILRVSFRECPDSWTFSPEVIVRARLVDAASGAPLREGIFAYGSDKWPRPSYFTQLMPFSVCRPIEDYCEEDPPVTLREELSRAIRLTVEEIVGRWNLRAE